jgi:hypothetical protein
MKFQIYNKEKMSDNNLVKKKFSLFDSYNKEFFVDVYFKDDNVWLTQKLMGELFEVDRTVITKHLKKIFEIGELEEKSNVQFLHFAHSDKPIKFYNLDAIISVGYRVNSKSATSFRIWATKTLKEFMLKGFVLDDERLKQGQDFNKNYFKELLERIRSIRASERRIYQQITDIFSECAIDYDKNSKITRDFFASVQNKFHYAITGNTASEIIYEKADSKKENMGLKTWKNSPTGRILKYDTIIAKNYLTEKEIKQLERTVSSFFDYIENLIERERTFTMKEFAKSVNKFLEFNEFKVLEDKGIISRKIAEKRAKDEYEKFNKTQMIKSDFDDFCKKSKKYLKESL